MRRFVIAALAVAVLAAGTLVIARTAPVNDEQAAKEAHRAFVANLGKGDRKAIGAVLDRRFTWTDVEGRALTRRETLKELPALAAANAADGDVQTHFYGRMFTVRGSHDNARFLRVFVKRRHGWKAFALVETPAARATSAIVVTLLLMFETLRLPDEVRGAAGRRQVGRSARQRKIGRQSQRTSAPRPPSACGQRRSP